MKETKRQVEFFPFYDKTGIARHLEKMAAEGWLLEAISPFTWRYRKIPPTHLHVAISYYADITDFEPEPTEEQQTFHDFCEHAGWKLAASTVQMQIFYNESDTPTPIDTDPLLEVENLHRKVKKTVLPSFLLLLFVSLLMGASFISTLLGAPIRLLSSATRMFTGLWFIVAFAYTLTELLSYHLWHRKAVVLARQGVFPETRGHRKLGYAVAIFLLVSVVLYLVTLADSGLQFYMTAYLLIFLVGFPLVHGVKSLLKKKKVKASVNKSLTFAASFALAFVLMGALTAVTIAGIRNGAFENDLKELPLTIGELLDVNDSDYIQTRGKEDSILLGQYRSSQHPNAYDHTPTMAYTITEVKMPFLYDFVVDEFLHQYEEWRGYDAEYAYVAVNAEDWGADQAWELYRDGKPTKHFLVCYGQFVLEIEVDWELTDGQKQIIRDKLRK